jgi:hypothetical protein
VDQRPDAAVPRVAVDRELRRGLLHGAHPGKQADEPEADAPAVEPRDDVAPPHRDLHRRHPLRRRRRLLEAVVRLDELVQRIGSLDALQRHRALCRRAVHVPEITIRRGAAAAK